MINPLVPRAVLSFFMAVAILQPSLADMPPTRADTPPVGEISREQAEAECASYPTVPVNVNPVFEEPRYDYSVDIPTLQTLSQDPQHTVHGSHHGLTLGLTRYEPVLEFRVPIRKISFPDGLNCAHVDHVDVTIGY